MRDTIFAFATAPGRSALAVLRISGPESNAIRERMLRRPLMARRATVTDIFDPEDGSLVDRGVSIWFPGPRSFSGEDCLELHLHGSRAVRLAATRAMGQFPKVRPAEPGEFVRRAFLNGKNDLTAVEGLADLLDAQTDAQRRLALAQANGALFQEANKWKQLLMQAMALLEATIDFSDEDDTPDDVTNAVELHLGELQLRLARAIETNHAREVIRDGLSVALLGPPNSGKSSLINALANRDVAIVSDTPGTTRDIAEASLDLRGFLVVLRDTAGIRSTQDQVEAAGIARAIRAGEDADLLLVLRDQGVVDPEVDALTKGRTAVVVNTKADLCTKRGPGLWISCRNNKGIAKLLEELAGYCESLGAAVQDNVVSNARQLRCVSSAAEHVSSALASLRTSDPELLCEELRLAQLALSRLVGLVDVEELLGEIFSRFCIGK